MQSYILPFISVLLGYLVSILAKPKDKKSIKLLLAFSGAFLLTMTVSHLLPEVYAHVLESANTHNHAHEAHNHDHDGMKTIGLFIMLGIVFQIVLEFFSKGAEHGHVHIHEKNTSLPWLLFGSLCLHALFEGMPISQHGHLAWGIAIHHFPIAIILTLFFTQANLNKKFIFMFMILFAFMTPLGTWLAHVVPFLTDYYAEISAFVIGILFHISSTIIFESNEGHRFNSAKLLAIILGIVLGVLI
ncbi:MAG TPA: hypothetical protein VLY87_01475 [Flavobacterium sp.]|nr:hypothetical protein [Flavobacterium sp.]